MALALVALALVALALVALALVALVALALVALALVARVVIPFPATDNPAIQGTAAGYSKRMLPGVVMERSRGSVTAITPKATAMPTPMRV